MASETLLLYPLCQRIFWKTSDFCTGKYITSTKQRFEPAHLSLWEFSERVKVLLILNIADRSELNFEIFLGLQSGKSNIGGRPSDASTALATSASSVADLTSTFFRSESTRVLNSTYTEQDMNGFDDGTGGNLTEQQLFDDVNDFSAITQNGRPVAPPGQ